MKGKSLIETEKLLNMGLKNKALERNKVHLVGDEFNRIQRPPPGDMEPRCFILWVPDDADDLDEKPTLKKVVSRPTLFRVTRLDPFLAHILPIQHNFRKQELRML